jgi:hypothetical protein
VCEVGEHFWKALIEDETVVTAGLVAERASEPTLADADWAAQNDIVVRVDKAALGERVEELALVRRVLLFPTSVRRSAQTARDNFALNGILPVSRIWRDLLIQLPCT